MSNIEEDSQPVKVLRRLNQENCGASNMTPNALKASNNFYWKNRPTKMVFIDVNMAAIENIAEVAIITLYGNG